MDERDYDQKLDELERLLNDPDSRMEPDRVWTLLAEISRQSQAWQDLTPATWQAGFTSAIVP